MAVLRMLTFWVAAVALLPEAASLTLRGGDDGGDDDGGGGDGGMGGALAGLMGGGAGGGGDDDDDDANMVGEKKKKKGGSAGGIDVDGLEKGLANGGAGGLIGMLKAMRAAQGGAQSAAKIIRTKGGEEMYDFRDLDEAVTTRAPVIIQDAQPTFAPIIQAMMDKAKNDVTVPDGPMGLGKGGMMDPAALMKASKMAEAAQAASAKAGASQPQPLVSWPPARRPAAPLAVPARHQSAKEIEDEAMGLSHQPAQVAAPVMQMPAMAAGAATAGLYQNLAAMRANMDALMNQAAFGKVSPPPAAAAAVANTGDLAAKVTQVSENFKAEENKMETRVEALETENADMKKELAEQEKEMKALEHGGQHKAISWKKKLSLRKVKASVVPSSVALATTYATEPWEATFSVHLDGKAAGKEKTFTIRVHPEWAPEGAKRFQDMVEAGILKDARFFRVLPGFMVQFGIPGEPKVAKEWLPRRIKDDPVTQSNTRGTMTFATSGPNTRTTQLFVNYADNDFLDKQGFSPFAEVIDDGMDVVDKIYSQYKEKPKQGKIQHAGNKYLSKHFPKMSFIGHVDSTLAHSAQPAAQSAAFLQVEENFDDKHYRNKGIATVIHSKSPQGK